MNKNSPVAIYVRILKNDTPNTIQNSINICEEDIKREGNYVTQIFKEKNLDNILEEIRNGKNKFARIYCEKHNRFASDRNEFVLTEFELEEHDITLKLVEGPFDSSSEIGIGIMLMMASFTKWKRV